MTKCFVFIQVRYLGMYVYVYMCVYAYICVYMSYIRDVACIESV